MGVSNVREHYSEVLVADKLLFLKCDQILKIHRCALTIGIAVLAYCYSSIGSCIVVF